MDGGVAGAQPAAAGVAEPAGRPRRERSSLLITDEALLWELQDEMLSFKAKKARKGPKGRGADGKAHGQQRPKPRRPPQQQNRNGGAAAASAHALPPPSNGAAAAPPHNLAAGQAATAAVAQPRAAGRPAKRLKATLASHTVGLVAAAELESSSSEELFSSSSDSSSSSDGSSRWAAAPCCPRCTECFQMPHGQPGHQNMLT